MPTDHDALFRAICVEHEDDTPRLAFADWLDENDEPERAEFVRLEVEFERLMNDGSDSQAAYDFLVERDYHTRAAAKWEHIDAGIARRFALGARIERLWSDHGPTWAEELPKGCGVEWGRFRRGFAGHAAVTDIESFLASADKVLAAAPPLVLDCSHLTADEAERLVDAGLLPWVVGLTIRGDSAAGLRALGNHPAASGVRSLLVRDSDRAGGERVAEALAGSPHWAGLRTLDLGGDWGLRFDPTPAEVLFRAAHLRGLVSLRIRGNDWNSEVVRAFTDTAFPNLTDLRITWTALDDESAEVLAAAPSLRGLRYLDLMGNGFSGRGATALLCSPHLAGLSFLSLGESHAVRGLDRAALESAPAGGLRFLHCHGCRLTVRDVGALIRSSRLRDLWYLDLDDNWLSSGVIREIVRGFGDRCPPVIWLTMNRIEDEGAVQLANWPAAESLRVLQLQQNPLTDFGVRTLLNSTHLKNLDGLGVPTVGEAVAAAVQERFRDHGRVD